MKRAIDTIVHDQAKGPVPAGTPAEADIEPETAPAADTAEPDLPAAAQSPTSKRRRPAGVEE